MTENKKRPDFRAYYGQLLKQETRLALLCGAGIICFFLVLGFYYAKVLPAFLLGLASLLLLYILHRYYSQSARRRLALAGQPFPPHWQQLLENRCAFYRHLAPEDKQVFNQRVAFFLAEKKIEGISTEINDEIRLLVAASAIIPTFAFPFFEYPNLKQVLIYPNSFDHSFQTSPYPGHEQVIAGLVGNGFLNGNLLLSKPDLVAGFEQPGPYNVGIHEFVHLLDMADGAVDGLPELFLAHTYAIPWLQAVQDEVLKIRQGESDINPYGLTNKAEFLAVVSEYFFDEPEKFAQAHPQLYRFLCLMFHQEPNQKNKTDYNC